MKEPPISELEDAKNLIHGQAIDLIFGLGMWTVFNKANVEKFNALIGGLEVPAARMHLSHVLLSLCKIAETYKRYKYLLPQVAKESLKEVADVVEQRKIRDFRNKVIGHIWDNDEKRPMSPALIEKKSRRLSKTSWCFFLGF